MLRLDSMAVALCCAIGIAGCSREASRVGVDLLGPSGLYRVQLSGEFGAPWSMARLNTVELAATATDGFNVPPFAVHSGDGMDRGFRDRFAAVSWPAPNAIQFVTGSSQQRRVSDTIHVRNASGREIPVLQVEASDVIVVFRLAPDAQQTFHVIWSADLGTCVQALTRGLDGRVLSQRNPCVPRPPNQNPHSFDVTLHLTSVQVTLRD